MRVPRRSALRLSVQTAVLRNWFIVTVLYAVRGFSSTICHAKRDRIECTAGLERFRVPALPSIPGLLIDLPRICCAAVQPSNSWTKCSEIDWLFLALLLAVFFLVFLLCHDRNSPFLIVVFALPPCSPRMLVGSRDAGFMSTRYRIAHPRTAIPTV